LNVGFAGDNFVPDARTLDVTVDLVGQTKQPGRITLYVPARFQLQPTRSAGAPVGKAFLFLDSPPSASNAFTLYSGTIAAEAVTPESEAAAQACSPGTHSGIWMLHLRHGGQSLELPLYLAPAASGDPAGAALKLELCPPAPASMQLPDATASFASIVLSLASLDPPKTPGNYLWRAIITPLRTDGTTLNGGAAYELRARVPLPRLLTLSGRYLPAGHRALLSGGLRTRGEPQPRALVWFTQLNRTVTAHGPLVHDSTAAVAETGRDGRYAITIPLRATRGFLASSPPTTTGCPGPSQAPAGCRTTTMAGIESDPITISVP
jgi:hypothetical protein